MINASERFHDRRLWLASRAERGSRHKTAIMERAIGGDVVGAKHPTNDPSHCEHASSIHSADVR